MSAATAVIWRALDAGIRFTAKPDKIAYRAPAGSMTPDLRAEIQQHKTEILELLTSEAWADDPAEFHNWSQAPEPIAWTEREDVRLVVEDLFRDCWHPHRMSRVLGLTRHEVRSILGLER
jgi:hypothetical protein